MRLIDFGEGRIVSELVGRYLGGTGPRVEVGVGDDAAVIGPFTVLERVVATIDACPTPVVDILGLGSWRDWGRLAAVISLSDIAAMGASPIGLLSATVMPDDMLVSDYQDFLLGLDETCQAFATPIIGGNIREGSIFAATTVGLGLCERPWLREGAKEGDSLIVAGAAGLFWSATLDVLGGRTPSELTSGQRSALFDPYPKLESAQALIRGGIEVRASIDCSDGLGAAVDELCRQSRKGATIDYGGFPVLAEVVSSAQDWGIPVERLLLAWGDWQLLLAVPKEECDKALALLEGQGCASFRLGEVTAGNGVAERWEERWGVRLPVDLVGSMRFDASSYLLNGLYGYVNRLRGQ